MADMHVYDTYMAVMSSGKVPSSMEIMRLFDKSLQHSHHNNNNNTRFIWLVLGLLRYNWLKTFNMDWPSLLQDSPLLFAGITKIWSTLFWWETVGSNLQPATMWNSE